MEDSRHRGKKVLGDLPQWNSRFSFSAQRDQPGKKAQGQANATPRSLGRPRRVPLAAAEGAAKQHPAPQGASKAAAAAGATTPHEANKTPTLCLFERFERLTLATPSTAAPHTTNTAGAGHGVSLAAPHSAMGSAGSSSSAISSVGSERVRPARRSVAFGTPSVLAYTPARPGEEDTAGFADETPLWSNAGHTPYSLPGSTGSRMQELPEEGGDSEEGDSSSEATHIPLITATGVQRVGAPARHSGLCMELFTSGTREVTQEEAEVTPLAAAASRGPRSPASLSPADAESSDVTGPLSAAAGAAAAAEGAADEGSKCDESDMEMQTPAPLSFLSRLQYAAGAPASSAHPTPAAARMAPIAAKQPAGAVGHSKAACTAAGVDTNRALDAESPSGGSSFTGFAGGALSGQQAGSMTPTLFDSSDSSSRRTCSNTGGISSLQHLMGAGGAPAASEAAASSAADQTSQQQTPRVPSSAACSEDTASSAAAAAAPAAGVISSPPRSLQLPAPTPKSKLRQPERVAVEGRMVPTELHKLLGDSDAAAAAAAAFLGHDQHASVLGSCEVLSPVRARRQLQQALGATDQVLTPVRRSARKVKGGAHRQMPTTPAAVQPMLDATNYCYQPNDALPK